MICKIKNNRFGPPNIIPLDGVEWPVDSRDTHICWGNKSRIIGVGLLSIRSLTRLPTFVLIKENRAANIEKIMVGINNIRE